MLTVIIPDPDFQHGECRKEIHADTPETLAQDARTFIDDCGYGASDTGAIFKILNNAGKVCGTLSYNGRIKMELTEAEKFAQEYFYRGAGK